MAVGTGGTRGTAPHFSKSQAMCPFPCNLVALLEDSEDTQITSKICISSDFSGSKFQNFPVDMDPLATLLIRTGPSLSCKSFFIFPLNVISPDKVLKTHFKKPCQCACMQGAP